MPPNFGSVHPQKREGRRFDPAPLPYDILPEGW